MSGQLSTIAPHEQHEDNAWQTPDWLVERIHKLLGGIELDPCTTGSNPCSADRFYTPGVPGLKNPVVSRQISLSLETLRFEGSKQTNLCYTVIG